MRTGRKELRSWWEDERVETAKRKRNYYRKAKANDMNITEAFPSKWLKADEIEDTNLILTMNMVQMERIGEGDDQKDKPVLYFRETEKGLVLNKTNAGTITNLYGPDTVKWGGKKIALFATEVDFKGKQTLSIRVRLKAPKPPAGAQAAIATEPDDEADDPFADE